MHHGNSRFVPLKSTRLSAFGPLMAGRKFPQLHPAGVSDTRPQARPPSLTRGMWAATSSPTAPRVLQQWACHVIGSPEPRTVSEWGSEASRKWHTHSVESWASRGCNKIQIVYFLSWKAEIYSLMKQLFGGSGLSYFFIYLQLPHLSVLCSTIVFRCCLRRALLLPPCEGEQEKPNVHLLLSRESWSCLANSRS